jgi:archaellum component FlaC
MSLQNALKRVKITNLEHTVKRLRLEIENLTQTICINLDCSLTRPEDLLINEVDSQWDELKNKWADLTVAHAEIKRLEEELK